LRTAAHDRTRVNGTGGGASAGEGEDGGHQRNNQ
jgi:hypothetical protein